MNRLTLALAICGSLLLVLSAAWLTHAAPGIPISWTRHTIKADISHPYSLDAADLDGDGDIERGSAPLQSDL